MAFSATAFAVLGYGVCSSLMLVLNKLTMHFLPAPSFVLLAQVTASWVAVKSAGMLGVVEVDEIEVSKMRAFLPVAAAFLACIYANIKILQYANVETFIVFRASTPLIISVAEWLVMGRDLPNLRSTMALLSLIVGAIGYVYTDSSFDVKAYVWVGAWYVIFCFDQLYIKFTIDNVTMRSNWGRVYYTNLWAGIMLAVMTLATEPQVLKSMSWEVKPVAALAVACTMGVAMSYFAFACRKAVSATSFTVIGNVCKIITVVINISIWDKHASFIGLGALFVCLGAAATYQQSPLRSEKQAKADAQAAQQAALLTGGKGDQDEDLGARATQPIHSGPSMTCSRLELVRARTGLAAICALVLILFALWMSTTKSSLDDSSLRVPFERNRLREARCPHDNARFDLETLAANRSIDKPLTGKGAVVVLGQKRSHMKYGRDSLRILHASLDRFYEVYNRVQRDDVIIFHDGDLDYQTQAQIKAGRDELSFYLLEGRLWEIFPRDLAQANQTLWNRPGPLGYRQMIRFYAIHLWPILDSMGYQWVMRLDDDSTIAGPIPYNLFGFMETHGLAYAYRNLAYESGFSGCKWHQWVTDYVKQFNKGRYGWLLDGCRNKSAAVGFTPANCGQFRAFYNNFFIADVQRFMQSDIQHMLRTIDRSGVMFTHRWNDLIIQSLAVQLFLPKQKVHHFTGWGYGHHSGPSSEMFYGIAQAGRMAGTWAAQRAQLQHLLLKDWGWAPKYVQQVLADGPSANLHGMYTVHSKKGYIMMNQSAKRLEQTMAVHRCSRWTLYPGWLC